MIWVIIYGIGVILTIGIFEVVNRRGQLTEKNADKTQVMMAMTIFTFAWPVFWLIMAVALISHFLTKKTEPD